MHFVRNNSLTGDLDYYVRTITNDETLVWPGNKYYYLILLYR
jgi:hypothetical protein